MTKKYQGLVNDKERSKQRLINAVGKVLEREGYTGLTATKIAKEADLNRRLISLYFDSVDNLVETYIKQKNYWPDALGTVKQLLEGKQGLSTNEIADILLKNQLEYFQNNSELQKLTLWELSQNSDLLESVSKEREELLLEIFQLTDKRVESEKIDLRDILALLLAGSYYLVLHGKSTNSLFCGIDVNMEQGMNGIKDTMSFILDKTLCN
ncbi:TetR/AcrR family transcriptional regulator [Formosa sp. L2A11]|uniref:TetR/AcrR family transcriptional regulator n=1 Tax=Formosa sp. L2A11 TaxID=2686363 RepID=UPI00131A8CD2|nr:TetR/AcrR family transcriptional regulator [Formosa sp. L2A11]